MSHLGSRAPFPRWTNPQPSFHPRASHDTRDAPARYAMLNFELACLGARGEMDSVRARDFLISKGLCTGEEEWNRMIPGARNHSVVSWVAVLLGKAQDEGFISSSNMIVFNALLERARSNSSNWLDPVLYDVPYQYIRLLTSLVKVCVWRLVSCLFPSLIILVKPPMPMARARALCRLPHANV